MSKSKPNRLKAIAILCAVFLLGGGAGAAVMRAHMYSTMRDAMSHPPAKARARFRLKAMDRHLDLTQEQHDEIEAILADAEKEREEITADCRPAMEALRARTKERIDAVLTAEQRAEHEELFKRMRTRRKRHGWGGRRRRGHRGPPPHRPSGGD